MCWVYCEGEIVSFYGSGLEYRAPLAMKQAILDLDPFQEGNH